jgi:cytochrome c553
MVARRLAFTLALIWLGAPVATPAGVAGGRQIVLHGNGHGATPCVACHGAHGAGIADVAYPRLAGQQAAYLRKQLHDFRHTLRDSEVMQRFAKALSEPEIRDVAAYYAAQPAHGTREIADRALIDAGRQLARRGDWGRNLPPCVSCHGPRGIGVGRNFPLLAGQHAQYIEQQLLAWKQGTRDNDPQQLMKTVARRLGEPDIKAVAAYFASLDPAAAQRTTPNDARPLGSPR